MSLKEAQTCFKNGNFFECIEKATEALEDSPDNIKWWLLKGAAQLKAKDLDGGYESFTKATTIDPENTFASKGMLQYFTAKFDGPKVADALIFHLYLLSTKGDEFQFRREAISSYEWIESLLTKRKSADLYRVLKLQFPVNSDKESIAIYDYLFRDKPVNTKALGIICEHYETEFLKEISKINARVKQSINFNAKNAMTAKLKLYETSPYLSLLQLHINTEEDDFDRRKSEGKLVTSLYEKLTLMSAGEQKEADQENLRSLVEGYMMFEPSCALIYELNWDYHPPTDQTLTAVNDVLLTKFTKPEGAPNSENPVYPFLTYLAYFQSSNKSQARLLKKVIIGDNESKLNDYLKADINCMFVHKKVSEALLKRGDYRACLDAIHKALQFCESRKVTLGVDIKGMLVAFKLIQATCFTYYESPKNFGLAIDLFEEVLNDNPDNLEALGGKAGVLMQQEQYEAAEEVFHHLLSLDPENFDAISDSSWISALNGNYDEAIVGLESCESVLINPSRNAINNWRIGYCYWMKNEQKTSVSWFIKALKCNKNHAPSFTYLGLYYRNVAKDLEKSNKCFFKALELDGSQFIASEILATDFADASQWDLVEVVAKTAIAAIQSKGLKSVDWPYRAMGIVHLNHNEYAEAVKYFQQSLKVSINDPQSWIGLGETYINTGRFKSAEKALNRALELDSNNFSALFILSIAQRESLRFPESAKSLKLAIENSPDKSDALKWSLIENSLRAAVYFSGLNQIQDALTEIKQAMEMAIEISATENQSVLLSECAEIFLQLHDLGYSEQSYIPDTLSETAAQMHSQFEISEQNTLSVALEFAKRCLDSSSSLSKVRKANANLLNGYVCQKLGQTDSAIKHYQESIALESNNEDAWIAYGSLLRQVDPYASQHCFIRALTLNGHNSDTWVNLGSLYLTNGDNLDLAEEAVDRALSLDSEHCKAWILQAIILEVKGGKSDDFLCRTLEYAYSLDGSDTLAAFAFALKEYSSCTEPREHIVGALERLLTIDPRNNDAILISSMLLERKGEYDAALEKIDQLDVPEHKCRILLALKRYDEVIEQSSLINESSAKEAVLTKFLAAGLASYFLGELDDAISNLTEALSVSEDESILKILVEVLFSSGDEDARQVATDQLFESIQENGPTLDVTIMLGIIGILTSDEAVIEAAKEELVKFISPKLPGKKLAAICEIMGAIENTDKYFKRAVFQSPNDFDLWKSVDKEQALLVASSDMRDNVKMSTALVNAGGLNNCQRAVFLDPSNGIAKLRLDECM